VKPPRTPRTEMHALDRDEVRALLNAANDDPLEALFVLAVTSGMRLGELLGLQWNALDLPGGMAHVQRTLTRVGREWWLTEPKTRRSQRNVVLTETATRALHRHRVRQAEARIAAGPAWADHGLVFTDDWGEPLFGAHVSERRLRPLLRAANLPIIRFHDLRHTAASLALLAGTNPKVVAEQLGHSSVQITLDRYSHVSPTMQAEAARRIDELLA
jgi:integrase